MTRPDSPARSPDHSELRPATSDELGETLAYALQFNIGRRVHDADDFMARAGAKRLIEHLERSGFVVMKKPPRGPDSTG